MNRKPLDLYIQELDTLLASTQDTSWIKDSLDKTIYYEELEQLESTREQLRRSYGVSYPEHKFILYFLRSQGFSLEEAAKIIKLARVGTDYTLERFSYHPSYYKLALWLGGRHASLYFYSNHELKKLYVAIKREGL